MSKLEKASYASKAVQLDASRTTRDLGLNGLGLRLAGAGLLVTFGRSSITGSFVMPTVEYPIARTPITIVIKR